MSKEMDMELDFDKLEQGSVEFPALGIRNRLAKQ